MSERTGKAKAPTMSALLPSRLVPEDMLSEWQGPNLPNTKNYAPPPDSMRGRMGDVLMQGIAALGGFTGLPMSDEGNRAALLGELLAAGMPLVGGVKQLAKLVGAENKVAQGIKAFHGSPHDFDQFSLSKIGTGEGNQSYLRGLYFAENPAVAADYRKTLSRSPMENPTFKGGQDYGAYQTAKRMSGDEGAAEAARLLRDHLLDGGPRDRLRFEGGTVAQEAQTLKERLLSQKEQAGPQYAEYYDNAIAGIDKAVKDIDPKDYRAGRTYEVNINADPEDFLDWDAPLSQQSEKVRQKLPAYLQPQEGESMGDALRRIRMDEDPEESLRAAGIQGIKYLDEGSRGPSFRIGLLKDRIAREKAQGLPFDHWQQELDALEKTQSTRNYVVFDDTKISIVRKFGIAAALSAGAISELEARQMQAQGYQ